MGLRGERITCAQARECRGPTINPEDNRHIDADHVADELAEHQFPLADAVAHELIEEEGEARPAPSTARNTVIFGLLTGLSRIAGLAREVLAAAYYGTSAAASAFQYAFLIPNTVRSLFADSALSAAFIPVFSELLDKKKKLEAFRLATTLFMVMFAILASLTVLFIVFAGVIVPLVTPPEIVAAGLQSLTTGLSQLLFPVVLILGLNGLLVGILQAYDHFTIPALSPVVWNIVIMVFMVALHPVFDGAEELYAYGIGILVGTIVQFLMAIPAIRRVGFKFTGPINWRDRRVLEVFALMVPVTLGLGLININLLANSYIGGMVDKQVPAAINAAFRLYMLPQGLFSVAISTVLFPQLARLAARLDFAGVQALCARGLRLIFLMLLPATAATLALAEPITQLIFQRGAFDAESTALVSTALFWFSLSLPFSGINLLLTRTFFSLKRPWAVTLLALLNLAINVVASLALRGYGIGGVVMGTVIADVILAAGQFIWLRQMLGGRLQLEDMYVPILKMLVGSVLFAAAAFAVWSGLHSVFGESTVAQIVEVGIALTVGGIVYLIVVLALRVTEAQQLVGMARSRFSR